MASRLLQDLHDQEVGRLGPWLRGWMRLDPPDLEIDRLAGARGGQKHLAEAQIAIRAAKHKVDRQESGRTQAMKASHGRVGRE